MGGAIGLASGPSRKLAGDVLNTLTLRRSALFAILGSGTGKDIIMTTTRPPGGSVFLVEDEVMIRMMVADMPRPAR
jgi:hypothetical protein